MLQIRQDCFRTTQGDSEVPFFFFSANKCNYMITKRIGAEEF